MQIAFTPLDIFVVFYIVLRALGVKILFFKFAAECVFMFVYEHTQEICERERENQAFVRLLGGLQFLYLNLIVTSYFFA